MRIHVIENFMWGCKISEHRICKGFIFLHASCIHEIYTYYTLSLLLWLLNNYLKCLLNIDGGLVWAPFPTSGTPTMKLIQHSISWLIKVSVSLFERLRKYVWKIVSGLSILCLMWNVFHLWKKVFLRKWFAANSDMKCHENISKSNSWFLQDLSLSLTDFVSLSSSAFQTSIHYAQFISSMLTDNVSLAIWLFPSIGLWLYVSKGHKGLFLWANRKR